MVDKVFVSYRADDEGNRHKNLLVAWSKNKSRFPEIKFYDQSVGVSIKSEDANYIKRVIIDRIKKSDVFLCLIGENTGDSDWVNWEIEKASELNKKIVAVKIKKHYTTPLNLYGIGAKWALDFTYEAILGALEN